LELRLQPARGPEARRARIADPRVAPTAWNAGLSRHSGPQARGRGSLIPRVAPTAWNAGFSRHSGPQARRGRLADPPGGAHGLERRSPDRHARRSAPRTSQPGPR